MYSIHKAGASYGRGITAAAIAGLMATAGAQPGAWTEAKPLNSYALTDNDPLREDRVANIGAAGNTMIATWTSGLFGVSGNSNLMISRSGASGLVWTDERVLHPNAVGGSSRPEVDSAGSDRWIISWPGKFTRSTDGGQNWSAVEDLTATVRPDSSKVIISGGDTGTFVKAYPVPAPGTGTFLSRSTNGGATWASGLVVPLPEVDHIVYNGGGKWFALSRTSRDAAVSTNDGASWTNLGIVNLPWGPETVDDIVSDRNGRMIAVKSFFSSNVSHGAGPYPARIEASISVDNGATWSAGQIIHSQTADTDLTYVSHFPYPNLVHEKGDNWAIYIRYRFSGRTLPLDISQPITNKVFSLSSTNGGQSWSAAEELTTAPDWDNTGFEQFVASEKATVYTFNSRGGTTESYPTSGSDFDNFYRTLSRSPAAASDWQLLE